MQYHHNRSHDDYGESSEIAAYLLDGARTPDEIADHFRSYVSWLGLFSVSERLDGGDKRERLLLHVQETMDDMVAQGWATFDGERYALTADGAWV